jgi:O-antigen ligase
VTVLESQGKDESLTGRTDLWDELFKMGQRHAVLGAGYESFWTDRNAAYLKDIFFWGVHQAHNGYIEIWLNLGYVGLLLFALTVVYTLHRMTPLFRTDFEYGRFRLVVILITLLHNISEAGFPRSQHLVWFVFLLVMINVQSGRPSATAKALVPIELARQV